MSKSAVKVLQMVSTLRANGAAMHAARFCGLLQAAGHEVVLAAPADSWIAHELLGRVPRLPTNFDRDDSEFSRLADFCRREDIDATHSHSARAHQFGWMLEHRSRIPHLAQAHSHHLNLHWFCQHRILALTADAATRLRRQYFRHPNQVAVLPNYVDTQRFQPPTEPSGLLTARLGLPPQARVIVCAALLSRRKGQRRLVQALHRVRTRHPDAHLLLLGAPKPGSRYATRLQHEVGRLGLADHVTFAGFRNDVADLLPHAHIAVLPSVQEPFALAGLEAMASGLPLVATRVGGFPEMVADGETGFIVPRRDLDALTGAIDSLLADDALRLRLGRAARQRVEAHFTARAHLRRYETILRQWGIGTPARDSATDDAMSPPRNAAIKT